MQIKPDSMETRAKLVKHLQNQRVILFDQINRVASKKTKLSWLEKSAIENNQAQINEIITLVESINIFI
jgi:hypothetical protein